MPHVSSRSTKTGASLFEKELTPSSRLIHKLMDDQEDAYVQVTAPEPASRGPAPLRHRSHIVRDRYFAAAASLSKATHQPSNSNQKRHDRCGPKRDDASPSAASRTPPRPSSAVATPAPASAAAKPTKRASFEHLRLYHFYNRQVFSLGTTADDQPDAPAKLPKASLQYQRSTLTNDDDSDRDGSNSDEDDTFDTSGDDGFDDSILDAHPQSDDLYDQCFEADWAASHIEKIVKDGVERRRIYAAIKPHYRLVVCLFRQFATCAPTPTEPFRLTAKAKLLEGLNVVVADPTRHGINDQPIPRHGMLSFLVHVALVYLKREELVTMLKRLAREGLDMSSAFHHLLHDNILPYANVQDGAHFCRLFHDHADVQCLHFKYVTAATKVFQAHAAPATSDPLSGSGVGDPPSDVRFLKLAGFLSILSLLHQMDGKFDDTKATHVFVSCLPIWPDEYATAAQELTFASFQEALTKVAYVKCALALCNGDDDVCPGRANSERCTCPATSVDDGERYTIQALVDTLQGMLVKCGAPVARRSRRQSVKQDSLVRLHHTS